MKALVGIGLLIYAVALHFAAIFGGIYEMQMLQGNVWLDNVLHAVVGVAFVLIWSTVFERIKPDASILFSVVSSLAFVLALAVCWEVFEHVFYIFFHTHALGLRVYPQPLNESVWDSLSNVAGAALFMLLTFKKRRPVVIAE